MISATTSTPGKNVAYSRMLCWSTRARWYSRKKSTANNATVLVERSKTSVPSNRPPSKRRTKVISATAKNEPAFNPSHISNLARRLVSGSNRSVMTFSRPWLFITLAALRPSDISDKRALFASLAPPPSARASRVNELNTTTSAPVAPTTARVSCQETANATATYTRIFRKAPDEPARAPND